MKKFIVIAVAAASVSLPLCIFLPDSKVDNSGQELSDFRKFPIAVGFDCPVSFAHGEKRSMASIVNRVKGVYARRNLSHRSPSSLLHSVVVCGPDLLGSTRETLEPLFDYRVGERIFGRSPIRPTRQGLRFVSAWIEVDHYDAAEAHRDQMLYLIANLGIDVTTPILLESGEYHVQDLLTDMVANFDIAARELEWTAVTCALYLPPTVSWHNRFDEQFNFDIVVNELLSRRFLDSSCGGLHIIQALIVVARVDSHHHQLVSIETRERLHSKLRWFRSTVVANQLKSGAWPVHWWAESGSGSANAPSVISTGHIIESLLLLNPVMEVPHSVLVKSLRWSAASLSEATDVQIVEWYCPYAHLVSGLSCSID